MQHTLVLKQKSAARLQLYSLSTFSVPKCSLDLVPLLVLYNKLIETLLRRKMTKTLKPKKNLYSLVYCRNSNIQPSSQSHTQLMRQKLAMWESSVLKWDQIENTCAVSCKGTWEMQFNICCSQNPPCFPCFELEKHGGLSKNCKDTLFRLP